MELTILAANCSEQRNSINFMPSSTREKKNNSNIPSAAAALRRLSKYFYRAVWLRVKGKLLAAQIENDDGVSCMLNFRSYGS